MNIKVRSMDYMHDISRCILVYDKNKTRKRDSNSLTSPVIAYTVMVIHTLPISLHTKTKTKNNQNKKH